jgi:uncharacterized protein
MSLGLLTIHLMLPNCSSLKEKRSRIKPILARLHKEFNVSASEIDKQDVWKESVIACAVVSNDAVHTQRVLQQIVGYVESHWPDLPVLNEQIELL